MPCLMVKCGTKIADISKESQIAPKDITGGLPRVAEPVLRVKSAILIVRIQRNRED